MIPIQIRPPCVDRPPTDAKARPRTTCAEWCQGSTAHRGLGIAGTWQPGRRRSGTAPVQGVEKDRLEPIEICRNREPGRRAVRGDDPTAVGSLVAHDR
jgi:hypothetical protein